MGCKFPGTVRGSLSESRCVRLSKLCCLWARAACVVTLLPRNRRIPAALVTLTCCVAIAALATVVAVADVAALATFRAVAALANVSCKR